MISVSNASPTPLDGRSFYDAPPLDGEYAEPPSDGTADPSPSRDALARFGAENGLHAQVQQFAHASPDGPTGGNGTQTAAGASAQAGAGASADATPPAQRAQAQAAMDEGVKLLQAHKYNAAIERFQEGFRLYTSPAFILNEAAALRDSGRYAEAVITYERYLGDPDAPRAGEARQALEQTRAHLGGREYTAADVAQAKQLTEAGAQAFREGRIEDAYQAWGDAYEHNPIPMRLFDQAICMQRLDANYSAARLFHAYAAADPKPGDAAEVNTRGDHLQAQAEHSEITAGGHAGGMEWMARGNQLLSAHRYDEAVDAFQQGFRTYPDRAFIMNEASALLDGGRYAEADLAYGRYLSDPQAPRADEARTAQLRAREHMGGREATATGLAESQRLRSEGETLYKAGKFADALQAFDRAYALNPLADLRYNQAACMDKMGAREVAASRYEAYLKEAPQAQDAGKVRARITKLHADALAASQQAFDRGSQLYSAGDFKGAAAAYAEAYAQKPFPQFLYNVGASLQMAGDVAGAVRNYQLYLNMAPDALDAGKVRKAIDTLQQRGGNGLLKPVDEVAEAKRTAAEHAFDRGKLAWDQGRWTDAAHAFGEAYALKPLPQILYNQAASVDKAGDTMGAVRVYQQYLNQAPDASDANRVRDRIHMLLDRTGDGLMKP